MKSEKRKTDDLFKLSPEIVDITVLTSLPMTPGYGIFPILSSRIDIATELLTSFKKYLSSTKNRKIETSNLHFACFRETSCSGLKVFFTVFEQLLQAIKRQTNLQNINNSLKLTWSGILCFQTKDWRMAPSLILQLLVSLLKNDDRISYGI